MIFSYIAISMELGFRMKTMRLFSGTYIRVAHSQTTPHRTPQTPRRSLVGKHYLLLRYHLIIAGRVYQLEEQYLFAEDNQFPEWGNFTYSTAEGSAKSLSFQSGYSVDIRFNYATQTKLQNTVHGIARGWGSNEPVFAFSHDFGNTSTASATYTIGSVQQPLMRSLTPAGLQSLNPWWMTCYGDMFDLIEFHYSDLSTAASLAYDFDTQVRTDIAKYYAENPSMIYSNSTNHSTPPYSSSNSSQGSYSGVDQFGEPYIFNPDTGYGFLNPNNFTGVAVPDVQEAQSYYAIVALTARQVLGAYVLTEPPTGISSLNSSEPLMWQKEISSDGNVNTVDVVFPAMSFFLYANPTMLRLNLLPLFLNQEGAFYPNGYSMHDLGSNFPNATGHVEGDDEYMPVEESGNMILMSYAYYKFSGDSSFLIANYDLLHQWATYLIEFSLIPSNQLSTGKLYNFL
jgi:hypothetical protein